MIAQTTTEGQNTLNKSNTNTIKPLPLFLLNPRLGESLPSPNKSKKLCKDLHDGKLSVILLLLPPNTKV